MERKTIREWYNYIYAEVQNQTVLHELQPQIDDAQTLLSDLEQRSAVSDHRIWIWIMAFLTYTIDGLFFKHKSEVNEKISNNRFGTLKWYEYILYKFQYGDTLDWVNDEYTYSTIDETKQVIKYANAVKVGRSVVCKIAKDAGGVPGKLDPEELSAVEYYLGRLQPPGETVLVLSEIADSLQLTIDVFYDPLVMNQNGELISDTSVKPVENAVDDYLNGVKFAHNFEENAFVDAIQKAVGVKRIYPVDFKARTALNLNYESFNRTYRPYAGYMNIDTLTINYMPNV